MCISLENAREPRRYVRRPSVDDAKAFVLTVFKGQRSVSFRMLLVLAARQGIGVSATTGAVIILHDDGTVRWTGDRVSLRAVA